MNPNDKRNALYQNATAEGAYYAAFVGPDRQTLMEWDDWAGVYFRPGQLPPLTDAEGYGDGWGWVNDQLVAAEWRLAYLHRAAARLDYAAAAHDACVALRDALRREGAAAVVDEEAGEE